MADYRSIQLAGELVQSLGSSLPAAEVETFLAKAGRASAVAPREDCVEVLQKQSRDPSAFATKYFAVKEKNYESLGLGMELLARISEDPKLKKYLKRLPGPAATAAVMNGGKKQPNLATSDVTTDSLQLVKKQLKAVSSEIERSHLEQKLDRTGHHETIVRHNGTTYQCPTFPSWFDTHPNLSRDFVACSSAESRLLPLSNVAVASQESALLTDLVHCLSGVDGKHIRALPLPDPYAKRTFQFADGTDPALQEMCNKVLLLAAHYSLVVRFVEQKYEFRFGRVNNALAAAMDDHLNEYLTFVVQTESQLRQGELRLQKLLFGIQPMLHIMSVLAHIARAVNNADARGGVVLSLLHQNAVRLAGDHDGQQVCLELTRAASRPYLQSLDTWLMCGVIEDPVDEFLVEDNQIEPEGDMAASCSLEDCDGYWEKRYTVRRERVPSFLAQSADNILRTGKYLNVIRQCGKNVKSPQTDRTEYTFTGRACERTIEKAYQFASKTLLEILMNEYDLRGRLRWMKHFFLLEQGDFISQFMDACEAELCKPVLKVEPTRVESLLGLVLRTSSAAAAMGGCYLEDLHTQLLTCSLPTQMKNILAIQGENNNSSSSSGRGSALSSELEEPLLTGVEGFTFRVDVKWPVSLILSSHTLLNYQILFRHLFYIKHVERLLCKVWSSNKVARRFNEKDSPLYRPAFALRQRMLTCVQSLECYMTAEVIEPNWLVFMDKINKVTSVDEVLECHTDFIDQCQRECMLTVAELLLPLCRLLDSCTCFCSFFLGTVTPSLEVKAGKEKAAMRDRHPVEADTEGWETFESQVDRHEQQFSALLHDLLELVSRLGRDSANAKLLNVLYTLDFNGYYASQLRREGHSTAHSTTSG